MATVAETKFQTCLTNVQNGAFGVGVDVGGTDNRGYPVNVSDATGLTYSLCVKACGGGPVPFQWSLFWEQSSAWLIPWLALVSQLPFGAKYMPENFDSVLLTVGSPTLAAYSLALTVVNNRWVTRKFARYTYPNVQDAIRILNSLQQSPIRVVKEGGFLSSLIALPQNDKWWTELAGWIGYTPTWSRDTVISTAWGVIAYIFTILDSFAEGVTNSSMHSSGQGVGSLWLWILPIIIGWIQISPKCDSEQLRSAVERANKEAYVATSDGKIVSVNETETEARAIELTLTEVDDLRRDEQYSSPIFNYARFLPWVQAVEDMSEAFQAASDHFRNHDSVDPSTHWVPLKIDQGLNRRNREGNRTQVEEYCTPWRPAGRPRSRWGSNVVSRMFYASALALMLQWGTAGGALIQAWYTPTRGENFTVLSPLSCLLIAVTGLGCRSASYLIYAGLSTIVWVLLVISSILTHYVTQYHFECQAVRGGEAIPEGQAIHEGQAIRHWPTRAARRTSIILRRLGKLIAAVNSLWVVLACVFQLGSVFDNCFCNSSVFSLGHHAYTDIAGLPSDVVSVQSAWIAGVCLASGTAVIFVAFVFHFGPLPVTVQVVRASPPAIVCESPVKASDDIVAT
jgi:hypothetical protein